MAMKFDPIDFVAHMGQRLVADFEYSAKGGTPSLIGSSKEHPARVQLQRLLPEGIGVGSGIIIDSFGGMSRQQDIIIYEKLAPVFSINDNPEATYYPIEGVIAAGEVKSHLGTRELRDAILKSESAKSLKRRAEVSQGSLVTSVAYRGYGNIGATAGTIDEQFDQSNEYDQIFTFVLALKFSIKPEKILKEITESKAEKQNVPNGIFSLTDGFALPFRPSIGRTTIGTGNAEGFLFHATKTDAFSQLLIRIRNHVGCGRTVIASVYDRYFGPQTSNLSVDVSANFPTN